MKDGYYWAKHDDKWHIVYVKGLPNSITRVFMIGWGGCFDFENCKYGDFEFGDKIEIPEKYES